MATGTNGIATVANCTAKGCTASGYSDTNYCPPYKDFSCPTYTTKNVSVSSSIVRGAVNSTNGGCIVSEITATLSSALPFTVYVKYRATNINNVAVTKTLTISAGVTSASATNPYGASVYVVANSISAYPYIGTSSSPTSTSLTKYYQYTATKQGTTSSN